MTKFWQQLQIQKSATSFWESSATSLLLPVSVLCLQCRYEPGGKQPSGFHHATSKRIMEQEDRRILRHCGASVPTLECLPLDFEFMDEMSSLWLYFCNLRFIYMQPNAIPKQYRHIILFITQIRLLTLLLSNLFYVKDIETQAK